MALNITILPENETTIIKGETVHFTSTVTDASGPENLTYQWIVDGSNVDGETDSTFDFTPENAGGYKVSCYVEDSEDGNDTSDETPVIVESETIGDFLESIADDMATSKAYLDIIRKAVE